MAGKSNSASQSANLIRSWLEEDSEDDDTYCSIAESSDDEIEDVRCFVGLAKQLK